MISTHRPKYHFLPPQNWMNDPNGLIHWQGEYHLFYQHNPDAPFWGNMHWGHAVSPDLVHWRHLPIALAPTPGSPDADGVFSGCAIDAKGAPVFFYTGVFPEAQCMAVGSHNLSEIVKYAKNPIIPEPPPGLELAGFRDPFVWQEDNHWWMVIGSGIEDYGGTVLLYHSSNLTHWEYVGQLYSRSQNETDPLYTASMWECPNFVRFDHSNKRLLLISACDFLQPKYTVAMLGDYTDRQFQPEKIQKFDHGDNIYYAPQVFKDDTGRTIAIGWISEDRPPEYAEQAGWAGLASLPRELKLSSSGELLISPIDELKQLRLNHKTASYQLNKGDKSDLFTGVESGSVEYEIQLKYVEPVELLFSIAFDTDDSEKLTIVINTRDGVVKVDTTIASADQNIPGNLRDCPIVNQGNDLSLRLFLDRSVLELYVNDRTVMSARYYPVNPDISNMRAELKSGRECSIIASCYGLKSICL